MNYDFRPSYKILQGDIRDSISNIGQVHCVVTSVPYFRQRLYGPSSSEIGQEADLEAYLSTLVEVFSAIDLHPQGSLWVNIGDKRANGSLRCIPSRFSHRMTEAGFRLADEVVWAKSVVRDDGSTVGNCMAEPCRQRLNGNGHEMLYRFVRSKDAWTDTVSVGIPRRNVPSVRYLPSDLMGVETCVNGRSAHNVWATSMGQTHERHYAVFPSSLVERPVAMSCPPFVNPDLTLPRRRVEWIAYDEARGGSRAIGKNDPTASVAMTGRHDVGRQYVARMPVSLGWEPVLEGAVPGVVLDPFAGTGTTGVVAMKMGRSFVGVDLYPEYVEIARQRCADALEFVESRYGYNRVYQMITLDQTGMKAELESRHRSQVGNENSFCHVGDIFSFS